MRSPAGPRSVGASELRALRLLTAMIAVTTLAATVGAGFATGLPHTAAASTTYRAALVAAVAIPLLAGAVTQWAGARVLRTLNAGTAIAFAALLVGLLLVHVSAAPTPLQIPWFMTVLATPATAALVAWGRSAAWAVLGALTLLVQTIRLVSGGDAQDAIANDTFSVFAAASLLLLTGQFVAASRRFDAATAQAGAAAARRSADEAARTSAERLRLLVHDELLSTLSLAARVSPTLREAVGRQAARAGRLIRELAASDPPEGDAPPPPGQAGLARRLADAIAELAPDTRVIHTRAAATSLPADIESALVAATRQALANSVAHAGDGARRTVTLHEDGVGVRVTVADDGRGFDPQAVAPDRMGVAESVLGRMRALPGGTARLESRPGGGTTVELGWRAPTTGSRAALSADVWTLLAPGATARRLHLVAVIALLAAQAVLAALAALRAGNATVAVLALALITAAFAALGPLSRPLPSRRRSALVAVLVLATGALSWLPVTRDPERFGDAWYLAALAFVLLALAMRGRARTAALTAVGLAVVAFAGVLAQPNDAADVVAATTRMLAIVGVGYGFVQGIVRVRERTTTLHREELRAVREESYRTAAARELRGRTAELETLIGDLLERLAGEGELDAALRRECVVLEGRLRDGYRAARLARHPLVDAAAAARARGVDVALLDEPGGRELDEAELERIVGWLAARLDETMSGRFTGRVLPADRAAVASAAHDERVEELPAAHSRTAARPR